MFQGILIFGILAIVLVLAVVVLIGKRRTYEDTGSPADELTDEQFRKFEFGDDDSERQPTGRPPRARVASTRPDVFTRTEPKGRRYVLRSRRGWMRWDWRTSSGPVRPGPPDSSDSRARRTHPASRRQGPRPDRGRDGPAHRTARRRPTLPVQLRTMAWQLPSDLQQVEPDHFVQAERDAVVAVEPRRDRQRLVPENRTRRRIEPAQLTRARVARTRPGEASRPPCRPATNKSPR